MFKDKNVDVIIFSKSGFSKEVVSICNENNYKMITMNNLYEKYEI